MSGFHFGPGDLVRVVEPKLLWGHIYDFELWNTDFLMLCLSVSSQLDGNDGVPWRTCQFYHMCGVSNITEEESIFLEALEKVDTGSESGPR